MKPLWNGETFAIHQLSQKTAMERMSGFADHETSQHGQACKGQIAYEVKDFVAHAFILVAKAIHVEQFMVVEDYGVGQGASLD